MFLVLKLGGKNWNLSTPDFEKFWFQTLIHFINIGLTTIEP